VRRRNLHGIGWGGYGHDGDTESENETADDELGNGHGGRDDNHAEDDDDGTAEHALLPAIPVGDNSSERAPDHGTTRGYTTSVSLKTFATIAPDSTYVNIHSIEGEDHRDLGAFVAGLEGRLEVRHGKDGGHEGSVITVGAGAAEGNEDGEIDMK